MLACLADAQKLSLESVSHLHPLDCSRGAALMQLLNVPRIRFNPKYCVSDSAISGEEVSTWKPPHTRKYLPLCHEFKSSYTLLRSPRQHFPTLYLIYSDNQTRLTDRHCSFTSLQQWQVLCTALTVVPDVLALPGLVPALVAVLAQAPGASLSQTSLPAD